MSRTVAVVLAGGESRRFGRDKLAADLDGRTLLATTLDSLPPELPVVVVGPPRDVGREVTLVREEPPGGGPAAGLVAGIRAALDAGAERVVTLPGDAPAAGAGVRLLLDALDPADLAVAVGADGQVFPLQLALTRTGGARFLEAAGDGAGLSPRRLLQPLAPVRVLVGAAALRDVDVPTDLAEIGADPTA
ncbi:molybdenum cofactor guanylyltransferase [Microlunatus flavus]|uniref:Molybdopterin-guanine dinucleotide biosynthesis protein A n=1 Tax=Microlunatus flavus TaxID=1036181 RepID=A0A1H9LX78_9ACTN|nr:NTP transferase domain-containing protein [Microlunatus flavus]SER16056.1 Molybdopterin-guanine dinucleotide biosynthesis protein A [Microlunatus flavus]